MGLGSSKKEKDYFDVNQNTTRIDIRSKKIVEIKKIPELPDLRHLNITYNEILILPPSIGSSLPNLEILILSGNNLNNLPNSISRLENLRVLDLSKNKFNDIPLSVSGLLKLEELILYSNKIKMVCILSKKKR